MSGIQMGTKIQGPNTYIPNSERCKFGTKIQGPNTYVPPVQRFPRFGPTVVRDSKPQPDFPKISPSDFATHPNNVYVPKLSDFAGH